MYPYINIFGRDIPGYGLMIGIGILCLAGTLLYFLYKYKVPDKKIDRIIILTALSGLFMYLSAAFFDALWHNIDNYRETGVFEWKWYGITFAGGIIGAILFFVIGYWFLFKDERYKLTYYLNFVMVGVVIAHAFGRIGCFLGGCCYGAETSSWLGISYPVGYLHGETLYANVYPTQLFESGFLFILFIFLFFVVKKNHLRYYLICYGSFRFVLEFFRGDSRGATIGGLISPSQLLSILMVVAGILLFIFEDKLIYLVKKKYNPELISQEEK